VVSEASAAHRPPPGFVDTPPPPIKAAERLVARVEEIDIDRPLAIVIAAADAMSLEDAIDQGGSLPHVVATRNLTPGPFDAPGSRRIVFLSDGSTLVEQILEKRRTDTEYRFRYVVWNYGTRAARPILYGLGDFHYTATSEARTRIRWVYAFELRRDRFPGVLGPLGDWLLKVAFLDRDYAKMMQGTLRRTRAAAEAWRT